MIGGTRSVRAAVDNMRAQVHAARKHVGGALIRWSFYVDPSTAAQLLTAIEGAAIEGEQNVAGLMVTVPLLRRTGKVLKAGRFLGQPGSILMGHVGCDIIAAMDGVAIRVRPRCARMTFLLVEDAVADRFDADGAAWPTAAP